MREYGTWGLHMRLRRPPAWLLVLMSGTGRNVPLSPASTWIPKPGFEKANPSPGIRSIEDVFTILLIAGIAAALIGLLVLLAAFVFRIPWF